MNASADKNLQVVDPHIHIWDLKTRLYPRRERRRDEGDSSISDYLVENLLADAGSVRIIKAVHVEGFPVNGLAEARHVQELAEASPNGIPQGIVAYADLSRPDVGLLLDDLSALDRVRGIRQVLYRDNQAQNLLDDPAWCEGFGRLQSRNLSFDLQLSPGQAEDASRLALNHPGTAIAVNHAGWPKDRSFPKWREWRRGLRLLAACENVWIKISGFGIFERSWTIESIRPYVFEAIEAFGVERAMFASNFPVDGVASGYPALWEAFGLIVTDFPEEHQSRLFCGNAEQFYRI